MSGVSGISGAGSIQQIMAMRQQILDRSQLLHDFLRDNVDAFRAAQDQARQGNDPVLRAKREVFEREIAKLGVVTSRWQWARSGTSFSGMRPLRRWPSRSCSRLQTDCALGSSTCW